MSWPSSNSLYIWIFNVGRGLASFIRTGLNHGMIIDVGKSDDYDPAGYITENLLEHLDYYIPERGKRSRISQAILSHPHSDHILQCQKLKANESLYPAYLTCPHDKDDTEKLNWNRINNYEHESEETYKSLYSDRLLPLQTTPHQSNTIIPEFEYGIYYIPPPICERIHPNDNPVENNKYGNCTSLVVYFRFGKTSILFPGDITPEGMEYIIDDKVGTEKRFTVFNPQARRDHPDWHMKTGTQPKLRELLGEYGLTVLIAPHHGLESGFSEALFSAVKGNSPGLAIISERRHKKEGNGTIHQAYSKRPHGLEIDIEGKKSIRKSISTINGHHILIILDGSNVPRIYMQKNERSLLNYI